MILAAAAILATPAVLTHQSAPTRPREVWVFRSVLDNHARMATVALDENLWVAYDATNCGLYKAWNGGVKFDGAVYTSSHGPQPTSIGAAYQRGEIEKPVWSLTLPNSAQPVRPTYKGYRIIRGQVQFHFQFPLSGDRVVDVYETPEVVRSGSNIGLERRFMVTALPAGATLSLDAEVFADRALSPPASISTTGDAKVTMGARRRIGEGTDAHDVVPVTLRLPSGETTFRVLYGPPVVDNTGLWASLRGPQDPPRMPGLAMRVYWIDRDMNQLPTLVGGQSPNVSVVIPRVDLRGPEAFGGLTDRFYTRITGFLNITQPGEYEFRLTSDDGAVFYIRDEKIVDNDGLQSSTSQTGKFRLDAGEHPILIEHFEQGGDERVTLAWKKPGDAQWSIVPESAFTTIADEVRVTAPGRKAILDPLMRSLPGDTRPLEDVHPSYRLVTIRPETFRPRVGGIDFLPDGRMVVCTWDPDGAVYVLDGVQTGEGDNISVKRIAFGLAEPLGIKVVDGQIYVLQKQELTRLVDVDGDEVTDYYECIANGWGVTSNFHEFAFGLVYHDGHFYGNLAVAINPGGATTQPQNPDRGTVIKISPKGTYEFVARGLRTPNGIGLGPNNEIVVTDNQGDWLPSSKVMLYKPGAFFGSRAVDPVGDKDRKEMPPIVWLPQGEIGNSPSQPAALPHGPYKGQMVHGDVTHGGLKRVFFETIDGVTQGTVFRFTQGLEGGVNRVMVGPNGSFYVGGIGSTGNWGQEGKERYGLQRLDYTGAPTFEVLAVRVMGNGLELEFTEPVAAEIGNATGDYTVRQWQYVPTEAYGGPKVNEQALPVKALGWSPDRRKVFLEIDGILPDRVVYCRLNPAIQSAAGRDLWTTESWTTVNVIPSSRVGVATPPAPPTMSPSERAEGFVALFDGGSLDAFRAWRGEGVPAGWSVRDGALVFTPGVGGGDLATKETFGDFDLRFQWRVTHGANSGVMYRATEDRGAPWETGPEYQILDDERHADGRNAITSAGSNYAMIAPTLWVVRPVGEWNDARIVARSKTIEHWLNGRKVVEYTIDSPDWLERLAKSKFASMPDYARRPSGHLVFQDHGDTVAFRNIRVKRL